MKIMRPTGFHGNTSPAGAAGGHTAGGSSAPPSSGVPAVPFDVAGVPVVPFDAAGTAGEAVGAAGGPTTGATAAGATAAGRRRPGSAQAGITQPGRNRRRTGRGIRVGVSLVTSAATAALTSAGPVDRWSARSRTRSAPRQASGLVIPAAAPATTNPAP